MKKDKTKDTVRRPVAMVTRLKSVLYNETAFFVAGLVLVLFSVYLLLAFVSFFFTGAADQSIIDSGDAAALASVDNGVRNYAGSRGAQLAEYLMNDCFGLAAFFIPVFLTVFGLSLMRVRRMRI